MTVVVPVSGREDVGNNAGLLYLGIKWRRIITITPPLLYLWEQILIPTGKDSGWTSCPVCTLWRI
jgi:hypothetical protein